MKKISEQVIVIMGASSDAGRATALLAAEQGAHVVLAGNNQSDLRDLVCQIRQKNGDAVYAVADVSCIDEVDQIGKKALEEFGRVDSWINNESISMIGKLTEFPVEEKRRLFEVNFWGVVHSCRTAVIAMRATGGSIINVTSAQSELFPHGMDSVTKHAVKAYTDALRLELAADLVPISVCLANQEDGVTPKTILSWCETPKREGLIGLARKLSPGKSAAVAAGLGVAAFAAYKALQTARKPDEIAH